MILILYAALLEYGVLCLRFFCHFLVGISCLLVTHERNLKKLPR